MRAWSLFLSWAGRLCRAVGLPTSWPQVLVSHELMLTGGTHWARQLTAGPHAGGWQFPPELCQSGGPPPVYQSECLPTHYTTRRGTRQRFLARIVAVKRVRYSYRMVPFVVKTLYIMQVAFSEPVGDPDGSGVGVDCVAVACTDHKDPVESLARWMTRARLSNALG